VALTQAASSRAVKRRARGFIEVILLRIEEEKRFNTKVHEGEIS
jgi:hypothetical protein